MNTTLEERNTKRPREPDSTLSPKPKKIHHEITSTTEESCENEVISPSSTHSEEDKTDTTKTTDIEVKEEISDEFRSEERVAERLIPEEKTAIGEGTVKNKYPDAGKTELKYKGETSKEMTDEKFLSERKTDKKFKSKKERSQTKSSDLQTNTKTSMKTHKTSETSTLNITTSPRHSLESSESESITSTTAPQGYTQHHSSEKGGRDSQGKKKYSGQNKNWNRSWEKKVRPNYFVGIQVSNPAIHQELLKVQEDLLGCDESLTRALVDVATSHLTLLVAHLDTQEAIAVASAALVESAARVRDGIIASPLNLTFNGVHNFFNQVVFAQVAEDAEHSRLHDVAECVRGVFSEYGVCMPDTRPFNPHLTIAKLSKSPRTKGKHPVIRKIDPAYYRRDLDLYFGSQTVTGLQLLSMNKTKDQRRYYYVEKQVLFDVKVEEDKDHSGCCFPRRPTLPLSPHRSYHAHGRPTSSRQTAEGARSTWNISLAGVTSLIAGGLLLGFALARLRRNLT